MVFRSHGMKGKICHKYKIPFKRPDMLLSMKTRNEKEKENCIMHDAISCPSFVRSISWLVGKREHKRNMKS